MCDTTGAENRQHAATWEGTILHQPFQTANFPRALLKPWSPLSHLANSWSTTWRSGWPPWLTSKKQLKAAKTRVYSSLQSQVPGNICDWRLTERFFLLQYDVTHTALITNRAEPECNQASRVHFQFQEIQVREEHDRHKKADIPRMWGTWNSSMVWQRGEEGCVAGNRSSLEEI